MQQFDTAYFLAWVLVFLLGTALAKFCQAFVAARLGDPTAASKGRLTLNPAAHHEPLGLVFAFFLALGAFGVNVVTWGKPLELNLYRLRGGKLSRTLVGLVGPLVYLLVAFLFWLAFKGFIIGAAPNNFLANLVSDIILVNLVLFAFNLIPLYPLDGYEILMGILPADWEPRLIWMKQYGVLILIVIVLIVPFFLRINILFQFYVRPIIDAVMTLLGIRL